MKMFKGAATPEYKPIPMPVFPIEYRIIKIITEDFKFPESFEDDVNRAIMDGWKLDDLQIVSDTFVAFLSKIELKEHEENV